jgi:cell wall-associated NlpC family hydrolase
MKKDRRKIAILIFIPLLLISCSGREAQVKFKSAPASAKSLELMGFTIQAGAFAKVENAAHLTETLKARGLNATYFLSISGLFKVRFGNFPAKEMARQKALSLKNSGVIDDYYILSPEEYATAGQKRYGIDYLRESLVKTARDFIGVPYLWGGSSPDTGFDCSGLTMTVYQLNGLNLPRYSADQFEAGNPVGSGDLQKGDLVFFAVKGKGKGKISHVGVYLGDGQFIHAPSHGKNIRIDSLSSNYFVKWFVGGRTYL